MAMLGAVWVVLGLFSVVFPGALAFNHWVITEEGKIEYQVIQGVWPYWLPLLTIMTICPHNLTATGLLSSTDVRCLSIDNTDPELFYLRSQGSQGTRCNAYLLLVILSNY